jgi:hypothetical protein
VPYPSFRGVYDDDGREDENLPVASASSESFGLVALQTESGRDGKHPDGRRGFDCLKPPDLTLTQFCWQSSHHAPSVSSPSALSFTLPIVRTFLWLTDCVPVEQDAPDRRALRLSIQKLRKGDALVIFPEGTRSDHGKLRPFQLGPAMIAAEAKVPIVPCGLAGFYDAWKMEAPIPKPAPVAIVFGKPFVPQLPDDVPRREALSLITERMRSEIVRLIELGEQILGR